MCCQGFLFPSMVIRQTRIKKRSCYVTSRPLCFSNHSAGTILERMGLGLCKGETFRVRGNLGQTRRRATNRGGYCPKGC